MKICEKCLKKKETKLLSFYRIKKQLCEICYNFTKKQIDKKFTECINDHSGDDILFSYPKTIGNGKIEIFKDDRYKDKGT